MADCPKCKEMAALFAAMTKDVTDAIGRRLEKVEETQDEIINAIKGASK